MPVNLDFEARVPIPFSVFPSAYRRSNDVEASAAAAVTTETSRIRVEGEADLPDLPSTAGREGHRRDYAVNTTTHLDKNYKEEEIHIKGRFEKKHRPEVNVEFTQDRYSEPFQRYASAHINLEDRTLGVDEATYKRERSYDQPKYGESTIDVAEREYRQRTQPFNHYAERATSGPAEQIGTQGNQTRSTIEVETTRTTVDPPATGTKYKRDMGYYDEDGDYHSFRRGARRVADRIMHPVHGGSGSSGHHQYQHEEHPDEVPMTTSRTERVRAVERSIPHNTITIPCHHIRLGDLVMLQGRPCQVIRISTSSATGQHRYLGVDLFTKQLHEDSSFVSHPSPSAVVQNMLGPVFKQYRILDLRSDGSVVAMTETGEVKQGLPVLDQNGLVERLADAFDNGRGSVRVLVLGDRGDELAVDFKVVHASRL